MKHKVYLVLCEGGHEYNRIMEKHKLNIDDCILIYKYKDISKMYEGLLKLKYPKYEATYQNVTLIPDLWLWTHKKKIICEYEKEQIATSKLFDSIRWKNYNKELHKIVNIYVNDNILIKYEMIKTYKMFRKLLLAGVNVANCFKMIDFFYSESDNDRLYNMDEILDRYIQLFNSFKPSTSPLETIVNEVSHG